MAYKRSALLQAYCDSQARNLQRLRNIDYNTAFNFVKDYVVENYKPMKGTIIQTVSPGNTEIKDIDVMKYLESTRDKIVTPSGSLYQPTKVKESVISNIVKSQMKERKQLKKKQFQAANMGDRSLANIFMYRQSSVKIICNALLGGFASAFNIMYDKGGYNAITSTARAMIGLAVTTAEQLLGGNFSWFSEEDLINFIHAVLKHCPDSNKILSIATKYRLFIPTKANLLKYYEELYKLYSPRDNFNIVKELIGTLEDHEIIFLFYYCNLRNLIWDNDSVFRTYINNLFNCDNITVKNGSTVDDLYSHDEAIIALTTVVFANKFPGMTMDDIRGNSEALDLMVSLCGMMVDKLAIMDELFNTFINVPLIAPNIYAKTNTLRNTVIISDTDSVIFTAVAWDEWYRKGQEEITHEAYQITALMIYWLHTTVQYIMKVFSVVTCVDEENLDVLAMKNEFLYPIMLLYDIRKTYVGIKAVQEGNILPTPQADIKGHTLKGSMFCERTRTFTEDYITNEVLFKSIDGKLSAESLIRNILLFENEISSSIDAGHSEFFKITTLRNTSEYKNPSTTSVVKAWKFWEAVFGDAYGQIIPPAKVQIFPALRVTKEYLDWLKQYPKIYRTFIKYLDSNKQIPNHLIVNPLLDTVPKELIPLVNKRSTIFHNVQPIYSVLERLSISAGGKSEELLFSDMYSVVE